MDRQYQQRSYLHNPLLHLSLRCMINNHLQNSAHNLSNFLVLLDERSYLNGRMDLRSHFLLLGYLESLRDVLRSLLKDLRHCSILWNSLKIFHIV